MPRAKRPTTDSTTPDTPAQPSAEDHAGNVADDDNNALEIAIKGPLGKVEGQFDAQTVQLASPHASVFVQDVMAMFKGMDERLLRLEARAGVLPPNTGKTRCNNCQTDVKMDRVRNRSGQVFDACPICSGWTRVSE